jgi:hypothetical protein
MVSRDGQDADQAHEVTPEEAAITRAAAAWVTQLARTIKTCRLYDANNPTVARFREELGLALKAQVDKHGPLVLRFTGSEVFWGERLLYEARSREDNLAAPFFRDGIRTLTFAEGIEPAEVATFLDQVLRVTARGADEEDLVTLLWDAQLVHLDMTHVAAQADGDEEQTDQAESANRTSSPAPWPKSDPATGSATSGSGEAPPEESPEAADPEVRSDDWVAGHAVGDFERAWRDLEAAAPTEIQRFNRQHAAEREIPNITAAVGLIGDCMDSGVTALDRDVLATYLPRLLREAIATGDWEDARASLGLLARCESNAWSLEATAAELATPGNPISTSALRRLDQQAMAGVQQFLTLARELGPTAIEWLMKVVAESDQQRVRRPLLRVVAELCKDNPERLAPWLADERWYVVRNVVHILGLIGGPAILGLLRAVLRHPEPRVRHEVVASLSTSRAAAARELLVEMLPSADTRIFCSVLHHLASKRSPETARLMIGFLAAPEFAVRPVEECRAIYRTLGLTGDDETVTGLEAELLRTKWFSQGHEQHRQSVARCIARIGTPLAREVLERAAQSKNAAVRKAAQDALGGGPSNE